MNISNKDLFVIITALLSCIIIFSGQDPLHMNIVRTALVITLANFIAVSKHVRWISLETAGLLLLATSSTITLAGYVGGKYDFFAGGVMLTTLTLILISIVYMTRRLQTQSVTIHN